MSGAGKEVRGMTAREAQVWGRKLAALNRGANPVIDLEKAAAREVPLASVAGKLVMAEPVGRSRDPVRELSDAEFVVWTVKVAATNMRRPLSNCGLARVLRVSEARVRQLWAGARGKVGG